jgi:hypothetical protein
VALLVPAKDEVSPARADARGTSLGTGVRGTSLATAAPHTNVAPIARAYCMAELPASSAPAAVSAACSCSVSPGAVLSVLSSSSMLRRNSKNKGLTTARDLIYRAL